MKSDKESMDEKYEEAMTQNKVAVEKLEETIGDFEEKARSDDARIKETERKVMESQNETAEILAESKQRIQRLKKKYAQRVEDTLDKERIAVMKRVLQFT